MKLTLDTKVSITTSIGKKVEESIMTLKELGFTQNDLDSMIPFEIEDKIKARFVGYAVEFVDFE